MGRVFSLKIGGNVRHLGKNRCWHVRVNIGVPAPMAFFPFSGWKDSFYGDLHANEKDSLNFYILVKK